MDAEAILLFISIAIIIVVIIAQLYGAEKRSQGRSKLSAVKKHFKNKEQKWNLFLDELGKYVKKCPKCRDSLYSIWNLGDHNFRARCETCKGKRTIEEGVIKEALKDANIQKSFKGLVLETVGIFDELNNRDFADYYGNSEAGKFINNTTLGSHQRGGKWWRNLTFQPSLKIKTSANNSSRYISKKVRERVWARDNGECVECGAEGNLQYDHIIPVSKGGGNGYKNIQLLCQECNLKKSARIGG